MYIGRAAVWKGCYEIGVKALSMPEITEDALLMLVDAALIYRCPLSRTVAPAHI